METLEFILHGVDAPSGTYLAWESAQCPPAFAVLERSRLVEVTQALARALPDYIDDDGAATPSESFDDVFPPLAVPSRRSSARIDHRPLEAGLSGEDTNRFLRVARGPLLSPEAELRLMSDVAEAVLPEGFVRSVLEAAEDGSRRVLVVLNTPPSCGQVPWELLPTGRQTADGHAERLLDVVDVVTMGAILSRDADPTVAHPFWENVKDAPALYLIQPWNPATSGPGVLSRSSLRQWDQRVSNRGSLGLAPDRRRERADRIWLSSVLRRDDSVATPDNNRPLSHLLYVGHMTGDGMSSRLQLADDAEVFGRTPLDAAGCRWFSADDLVHGTWKWSEYAAHQQYQHRETGARIDIGTRWPTGVDVAQEADSVTPFDAPEEKHGLILWPMPPRVGLVACQSGTEPRQLEPFGMVTAILEAGAELVMATRWTMLTDRFFQQVSQDPTVRPFFDLSVVVDECLQAANPVREMNEWKRASLRRWREQPTTAGSPLTWAGLTAFRAPDRSVSHAGAVDVDERAH